MGWFRNVKAKVHHWIGKGVWLAIVVGVGFLAVVTWKFWSPLLKHIWSQVGF